MKVLYEHWSVGGIILKARVVVKNWLYQGLIVFLRHENYYNQIAKMFLVGHKFDLLVPKNKFYFIYLFFSFLFLNEMPGEFTCSFYFRHCYLRKFGWASFALCAFPRAERAQNRAIVPTMSIKETRDEKWSAFKKTSEQLVLYASFSLPSCLTENLFHISSELKSFSIYRACSSYVVQLRMFMYWLYFLIKEVTKEKVL